jgi:hypothetical protein
VALVQGANCGYWQKISNYHAHTYFALHDDLPAHDSIRYPDASACQKLCSGKLWVDARIQELLSNVVFV